MKESRISFIRFVALKKVVLRTNHAKNTTYTNIRLFTTPLSRPFVNFTQSETTVKRVCDTF